ncbi:Rv3235 family protein [Micromonospora sp. NPDC050686]|uniref:Rv3235 family protein n=1 Tax=Micromonospora sp. NPDC050686 TaxID=3154631 RepID=UPI0033EF67B2
MADSRRPVSPRPPVRLRPAPPIDPPFTDEEAGPWLPPAGLQLALDLFERARPEPARPAGRQRGPRPAPAGPGRQGSAPIPPTARASATPEAARAAHRFVATCLEILNGYRPIGQIRPLSEPGRSADVVEQLARAAARSGPVRRRSTRPAVRLRRLRVCEPRPAAVEVAVVLGNAAGRSWAMALRLEQRRGNWLCTTMQVL